MSKEADSTAPSTGDSSLLWFPSPPRHLGRKLPPSGENIISFPACFQMFIIFLCLFSLCKGFLEGTSSFWKPAVIQKHLLVLSPMQGKQPKKYDNYNKLIPYASSPISCVYIINSKTQPLHCRNFLLLCISTTLKGARCCCQSATSCGR